MIRRLASRSALVASAALIAATTAGVCASAAPVAGSATFPPSSSPATGDRAEVERLVERTVEAVRTEPETLLRLTNQALALLAMHPDVDLEFQVRTQRCGYFNEHDRDAALHEIELLRALAPRLRNDAYRAGMLVCEGELHEQSGDNTSAMALYEQAVGVAEAARDERRLAEALYMRGTLASVLGAFPRGLSDLQRALVLYEKLKLPVEVRTTINGVASLYNRIGALDEARKHYEDALRSMPTGVASRERVITQHNLGRNLERAGRWDDAQRQFEQVLAQSRELRYVRGEVHALRGLAAVRNAKDDGRRALQLIDEAQRLYGKMPDEPLRARLLVQRGIAQRLLHRPADAQVALREAIKVFAAGDAVTDEVEAREELAGAAADLGDWRQAYEQQTRARQIAQDLLRKQVDNRFATMRAQFDSQSRERELVMLQRENRAGERTLAEQRRAAQLQIVVAALASALALLLAVLVWRQRQTSRTMRALAMTDELTGLPNRRRALAALESSIAAAQGGALVILDIDHFKRINDQHGHAAGDAVLRAISAAWRALVGPEVTLGRLGGEEFVAVLAKGDLPQARALAEQLRQAVAGLDVTAWLGARPVTISAGVTVLNPGDSLAAALARADTALYRAKDAGRNRVEALP